MSASSDNISDLAAVLSAAAAQSEKFTKALRAAYPETRDLTDAIIAMAVEYDKLSEQLSNNREEFVNTYNQDLPLLIEAFEAGISTTSEFAKGMAKFGAQLKQEGSAGYVAMVQELDKLTSRQEAYDKALKNNKMGVDDYIEALLEYKTASGAAIKQAKDFHDEFKEGSSLMLDSLSALNKYTARLAEIDFYPVRSEFIRTIGSFEEGDNYLQQLGSTSYKFAREFGTNTEDAAKSVTALRAEFGLLRGNLDVNSQEMQMVLKLQGAFNVEATASSRYLRVLTQGYSMTTGQVENFYTQLANVSKQSGLNAGQVVRDMHEQSVMLSRFGINSTFAMAKLATASKTTGIALGDIFNVVDKFTTIGGAIETTAKLNAAFGTSLDAFSMFAEQDPSTIFATLQEQIAGATGDYNNLNKLANKLPFWNFC